MALIQLNYLLAMSQVDKLNRAAAECEDMAAKVQKEIDSVQTSWTGESADILLEKLTAWKSKVSSEADTLYGLASRVRDKANLLKEIDEGKGKKK